MFKSSLAEEMAENSATPTRNNGKTETPVLFIVGNKLNENIDDEKLPKKLTNAFERQQSKKVHTH